MKSLRRCIGCQVRLFVRSEITQRKCSGTVTPAVSSGLFGTKRQFYSTLFWNRQCFDAPDNSKSCGTHSHFSCVNLPTQFEIPWGLLFRIKRELRSPEPNLCDFQVQVQFWIRIQVHLECFMQTSFCMWRTIGIWLHISNRALNEQSPVPDWAPNPLVWLVAVPLHLSQ